MPGQRLRNTLSQSQVLFGAGGTSANLTTSWTRDERGLPSSVTDPGGNVTHYRYDEAGQLAVTTEPVTTATVYGRAATQVAPVQMTGYDTFGDPVESEDENGNVVTTARDAAGRPLSVTMPSCTPPDGSGTISGAQALTAYNPLGEISVDDVLRLGGPDHRRR